MANSNYRTSILMLSYWVILVIGIATAACTHAIPRFGIGGRYEEGKEQFLRGRGGDMDRAIIVLESVVSQDPTYKDSLTYLGRAYYRKGRYQDAFMILQRALAVNKDDEIAWLALGLTQLRLGQTDAGIETLKGGVTLANGALVDGYRHYVYWDSKGTVRNTLRRSVFLLTKGAEEKDNIVQTTDRLLALIDDEMNFQRNTQSRVFDSQYNTR
jgi:tetratricopeptide (TPR) repeat protein